MGGGGGGHGGGGGGHGGRKTKETVTPSNELRGKFLTKLWCCVGGKYNKIIWFHQLG